MSLSVHFQAVREGSGKKCEDVPIGYIKYNSSMILWNKYCPKTFHLEGTYLGWFELSISCSSQSRSCYKGSFKVKRCLPVGTGGLVRGAESPIRTSKSPCSLVMPTSI